MTEEERAARWRITVAEVARMPGVPERLLLAHVPDGTGHCAECSMPESGPKVFPCTLHNLGTEALRHG